jgi:hypothetical protein
LRIFDETIAVPGYADPGCSDVSARTERRSDAVWFRFSELLKVAACFSPVLIKYLAASKASYMTGSPFARELRQKAAIYRG